MVNPNSQDNPVNKKKISQLGYLGYLDKGISAMQPNIDAYRNANPTMGAAVGAATDATPAVASAEGLALIEDKCLGYVNLRLKANDKVGAEVVKKILGVELPAIERVADNQDADNQDGLTVLGLSPTEWLIITPRGGEAELLATLTEKLADVHSLVADVSGGTTRLNIRGKHAQDLLEKGTYVDLHDSVFQPGMFYATQIAHAPAIIVKNASNDFSLIVRRSFSNHIANWAIDGAAEYHVGQSAGGFCFV